MKKSGRGTIDEKTAVVDGTEISAVRWFDNKPVTLLSTYAGSEPVSEVRRWNGRTKSYENVQCPKVVSVYNKHMDGVDLIDSLIGLYRTKIKSRKWYHRLFFHLLDMTVINAWLLYRRQLQSPAHGGNVKRMSLHDFKTRISVALCALTEVVKRGRPAAGGGKRHAEDDPCDKPVKKRKPNTPVPGPELRCDGLHHYPQYTSDRLQCKRHGCSGQTRVVCIKCSVPLCFSSKQDCFMSYHTEEDAL